MSPPFKHGRWKRRLLPAVLLGTAAVALVLAPDALAQFGLEEAAGSKIPKTKEIAPVIARILSTALGLVGTLFLLLMVYAGFLWMTARGDSKKVDTAKQLIAGAVIGVMIIAGAYAITDFVLKAATGNQVETTTETAPAAEEGPACTASCVVPLDCGGLPDSCGICSSCKCADGSLSTNNAPCPSAGSCLCH